MVFSYISESINSRLLGLNVIFICDPMHGNTKTLNKHKVRFTEDITNEIKQAANILNQNGYFLSGVHLEATFDNVTECLGGKEEEITEDMVSYNYSTYCDPRLNFKQVIYMVLKFVK